MGSTIRNFFRSKKFKILLLVILLLLLSIPVVVFVRFKTESRLALREAKNVRLALQMYDIEAYAHNRTIYNNIRKDGLQEGLQEELRKYLEIEDCYVTLTSYDSKNHEVLGFIYERNHFQIIYEHNKETGDSYRLNYILHINTYGD